MNICATDIKMEIGNNEIFFGFTTKLNQKVV